MLLESAVENERRNKMRVEIDHVAIRTTEFDKARAFFEDVFSMQCYREVGQKPERKLWFLEGRCYKAAYDYGGITMYIYHFIVRVAR